MPDDNCADNPSCKFISSTMFESYCTRSTLKKICPSFCDENCKSVVTTTKPSPTTTTTKTTSTTEKAKPTTTTTEKPKTTTTVKTKPPTAKPTTATTTKKVDVSEKLIRPFANSTYLFKVISSDT